MNPGALRLWRRVPKLIVAFAVYALLATALAWPVVTQLDSVVIGHLDHPGCKGDLFYQYDMQQQMAAGEFPSHQRLVTLNHPEGMTLPPKDVFALHLMLYAAFMTVFGLLAAHNLSVLLMVVLDALAMHWLLRDRTGREDIAYLGGLLFGFGSYTMLKVQQGFPQKACLFFVPLFVLFLLRALERKQMRWHLAYMLCFVAILFVYPPYAVFDLAFAVPLIFGRLLRDSLPQRTFFDDLWRFAPSLIAVGLLFAFVMSTQKGDPTEVYVDLLKYRTEGGFMPLTNPFLWYPYADSFAGTPPAAFIPGMTLGFPVLVSFVFVLALVLRVRDSLLLGGIIAGMVLLMLGPYLSFGGPPGPNSALTIKLPFYYLATLPGGGALRYPIRLYPWVMIAMLLVASGGLLRLRAMLGKGRRARRLFSAGVLGLLLLSVVENRLLFPQYRSVWYSELPERTYYEAIRGHEWAALLLLPPKPLTRCDYLLEPIVTGRSLVNGYWGGDMRLPLPEARDDDVVKYGFLSDLTRFHVRYIVVRLENLDPNYRLRHRDVPAGEQADRGPPPFDWLDALCGPPRLWVDVAAAIYTIPRGY